MFGYGRLGLNGIPGLRRLAAKAGIRLRSSSRDYADVHGEGSIPVPLPPPERNEIIMAILVLTLHPSSNPSVFRSSEKAFQS
jgi:hypothetical protein